MQFLYLSLLVYVGIDYLVSWSLFTVLVVRLQF